ncbi:hypothetical protein SAMN06295926_102201 [Lysinibacillus sp. AC-3]|nr:hypothetical protein SAMN06295926_102201 [Lysinibacillus sp. AC-3]
MEVEASKEFNEIGKKLRDSAVLKFREKTY